MDKNKILRSCRYLCQRFGRITLLFLTVSCGSGSGGGGGTKPPLSPSPFSPPVVSVGPALEIRERDSVTLSARVDENRTVSYQWSAREQSGLQVKLDDNNNADLSLTAPSVSELEILNVTVVVTDNDGLQGSATVSLSILPYPNLSEFFLDDVALQACVTDAAITGGLSDVGEFTRLECVDLDVRSLAGLSVFTNLTELIVTNGGIE